VHTKLGISLRYSSDILQVSNTDLQQFRMKGHRAVGTWRAVLVEVNVSFVYQLLRNKSAGT
jgi:hypothetical protein